MGHCIQSIHLTFTQLMHKIQPGRRLSVKPNRKITRRHKSQGFWRRFLWIFGILSSLGFCMLAGLCFWFMSDLPDVHDIQRMVRRPHVTMYDRHGQLMTVYGDMYGKPIHVRDLPPYVSKAFLAIEDHRFYHHYGIDFIGLFRALWTNYQSGSIRQGGSTITQQLAKNFLQTKKIHGIYDRSLLRKVREAFMAFWLEYKFSKDDILTMYLNRVYFGAATYGLDGAALRFFGHSARSLSLYESAVLAGLLRAPSRYNPAYYPQRADARAQNVLNRMVNAGFITLQAQRVAGLMPSQTVIRPQGNFFYFTDWVYEQILSELGEITQDLDVNTTFDSNLQQMAEDAAFKTLKQHGRKWHAEQVALVAMTPDGAVRAMIGGNGYQSSQFNRATHAMRQAGSTFKYFVYTAAMQNNLYSPDTLISDAPFETATWKPSNYLHRTRGEIPLHVAFAKSVNSVAVRLLDAVGIRPVQKLARSMGISTPLPNDLTLSLGSGVVSLLEMTGAFATVPNQGYQVMSYGIKSIHTKNGQCVYARPVSTHRILSRTTLHHCVTLLENVTSAHGSGRHARIKNHPCGGKTGTTQNYRDTWFIGFTRHLVCGIWFGRDNNQPMTFIRQTPISSLTWHTFMTHATKNLPVRPILDVHHTTLHDLMASDAETDDERVLLQEKNGDTVQ